MNKGLVEIPMAAEGMMINEPVEVKLKNRRGRLAEQIEDIDKALKLLEEQPKLLKTLNVLRRVGF